MTAAADFDDAVHEVSGSDPDEDGGPPEPAADGSGPPEGWDFTFEAPSATAPPLLEAIRLALGVLKLVKVTAWSDLPVDTWKLLETRDVRLSEAQVALLDRYDHLLGFVRQAVPKKGDSPGVPGLRLAVCPECAKRNVVSWRMMVSGSGGTCALDSSHTGAMLSPTAVKTTVAARREEERRKAAAAAEAAEAEAAEAEAEADAAADRSDDPDETARDDGFQEELDFG